MHPAHRPLHDQIRCFQEAVSNKTLLTVLARAPSLNLPNWYLADGAISQTIWNCVSGPHPEHGIQDYDLLFADIPVEVEIRNQARVHLWYGPEYGIPCREHECIESAIQQWLTTSAMVGIHLDGEGEVILRLLQLGREDSP